MKSLLKVEVVAPSAIRPTTTAGDREIVLHHELDGAMREFGERFWTVIADNHEDARAMLFARTEKIVSVIYSDRYLFTPASIALLLKIVTGIRDVVGPARWADPEVVITTTQIRTGTEKRAFDVVYADWPDLQVRDSVAGESFRSIGLRLKWVAADKPVVQHGRLLQIQFSNGSGLGIRLDQGVTYWRIPSPAQSSQRFSSRFDFMSTIGEQAKQVIQMNVPVEGGAMPTELFIKLRHPAS